MPLYEYRCGAGHVTELIRPVSVRSQRCACGLDAPRLAVYAVSTQIADVQLLDGKRFIAATEEIEYQRAKLERREGLPVQAPDFYGRARKAAGV